MKTIEEAMSLIELGDSVDLQVVEAYLCAWEAEKDAERDAAFSMSRCECSPDEACGNLAKARARIAELEQGAGEPLWKSRLKELISDYWGIAYNEGRLGLSHDTPAGDAGAKWASICATIDARPPAPDQAEAVRKDAARLQKILRYILLHAGSVLSEHQFNVPGGNSLHAHNLRLGLIEAKKAIDAIDAAIAAGAQG